MTGRLRSIERAHGIKEKEIFPGHELKYILRDSQTCMMLVRPGKWPVRFTILLRKFGFRDDDAMTFWCESLSSSYNLLRLGIVAYTNHFET